MGAFLVRAEANREMHRPFIWVSFRRSCEDSMNALFATKAKRGSQDSHGMFKVLNACISRFPASSAWLISWSQSSGGWPLSSIFRKTR